MSEQMTRRELLAALGTSGLVMGLGMVPGRTWAAEDSAGLDSRLDGKFTTITPAPRHAPITLDAEGRVIQPQLALPVLHRTDVLVVGGGPAGFIAALAARRAGAKVALMERYGYGGGLWTGGLVLVVLSTHVMEDGKKKKVVRGIADECFERIKKLSPGIINQGEGLHNPTPDPEATKFVIDEMLREAGVDVFYHCWGADAVMKGRAVQGVAFESKSGRQAILAKAVIDATGDGDIYASAGAGFEQIAYRIGLCFRLGNVDRVDKEAAKANPKMKLGSLEPNPSSRWVNLVGPSANCLDVKDLSRLEMLHRRTIWNYVEKMRQTPGYEKVFLLQTAPQLGVRVSRLLDGVATIKAQDILKKRAEASVVAIAGSDTLKRPEWPVPYGALVPKEVDNILAAGRCVACERGAVEAMRLIPACMVIGQAAGVAAALSASSGVRPRDLDVAKIQGVLKEQGQYLG